jgi:hypothetical protein
LLRELVSDLPPQALLVADAGLTGYDLLRTILAAGHHVLVRVGANVKLLQKLGYAAREHEGRVYLWPLAAQQQKRAPLVLRLITLVDGRNRRMCLLTNLEPEKLSEREARELYGRRWGVELLYRGLKQTLARRKMLSTSPAHAQMELDWSVLGLWMLGLLLLQHRRAKAPASEGLAQTLRIVRRAMAGRGDGRSNLLCALGRIRRDGYRRRHSKRARDWPHKKNEPPCGLPQLRMATREEIRMAKRILLLKLAA